MANIGNIIGIEESIRHDAREIAGKLNAAISMEKEFIEAAKAVLGRFASVDKADEACRKAVYYLTETTDNYLELNMIVIEHEKKLRKLMELQSFVGGWEREFK